MKFDIINTLIENIHQVIKGKPETLKSAVITLLAEGHLLLEDVPGVGKTTLAKALAKSMTCIFRRIQCTPDLLPSDITGSSIYNQKTREFEFIKGPIFANILLVDEINRATPRTQSALLEVMNEFQVTVDNVTYLLPKPFMVIATQNPIEFQGTFPLPESQMDRFLMRIRMGYPEPAIEKKILLEQKDTIPLEGITEVMSQEQLLELQAATRDVKVDPGIAEYIVTIANFTRKHNKVELGVSPRGCLGLMRTAQALALLEGRDHCLPDDVKQMVSGTLAHRLMLKPQYSSPGEAVAVLMEILKQAPVPV